MAKTQKGFKAVATAPVDGNESHSKEGLRTNSQVIIDLICVRSFPQKNNFGVKHVKCYTLALCNDN